jgi:UDP-3-O-[3-hydroxymyristoyl] glucosamine N-acyltransferase
MTLAQVAALLNCPPPAGSAERVVTGVAVLEQAGANDLSFLGSDAHLREFSTTRAAAVMVQKRVRLPAATSMPVFLVEDADLALATVLERFAPPVPRPPVGIDAAARIAPDARIDPAAAIGPFVTIGSRARVGAGTILHAGVYVGDDTAIGRDCELFPHVVLRERITLGDRVIVHAGSVLGSDGFGYRWNGQKHVKIPQIGVIVIEDDVEIGSCVCIDRAKVGATRVGRGTKIDNLVQVAHNVEIGPHCIIVGQAGIAGSARLGSNVVLGGQAAVRDHVVIGDGAMAAACAAIAEDIEPNAIVSGMPALPHRQSLREQAAFRRLPDLVVQVRKLQEEIEKLKGGGDDKVTR